ncbi:hypothetical protein BDY24DRAFT_410953 [Mrakia frigida]|uniref:uncharacterized protein n=1 Tax=Mrakia frigida TaxID=29902 RepID=UPI003FCC0ECE
MSESMAVKMGEAFGLHAEKALEGAGVDEKTNLVLRSVHPSPLSASRGFFETGHFKEADEWLKERWGADGGVDWTRAGRD